MSAPDAAAAVLWIGATLYAVFGGADFGAGIWDTAARGDRGRLARETIERSLTPVWEANHVWLIFCLVVLWTAFPQAFAAVMTTLFIPLCLAALGIVLRGAGFAFRKVIEDARAKRMATLAFSSSSLLTPFFMGTVVGAIATGRVPAGGDGDLITSWLAPAPLAIGLLFVATSAYLAAVFLSVDAGLHPLRRERPPGPEGPDAGGEDGGSDQAGGSGLQDYFIRRALVAALVAGVAAAVGVLALRADSEYVFDRLTAEALPLVFVSAVAGLGALAILLRAVWGGSRPRRGEGGGETPPQSPVMGRGAARAIRPLAVLAVVAIIWAWAVAQYPYLLPTDLTLAAAAAPAATLTAVFIVFAIAVAFVLPALALLYILTQRQRLGE